MSAAEGTIRGLIYWVFYVTLSLSFMAIITLAIILPLRTRFNLSKHYSWSCLFFLRWICRVDFEIEGKENIPINTPAVAMGNHQSIWETLAAQLIFIPNAWVLKRELMWIPIFGWGIAALKPIAIKRASGRKAVDQLLSQGFQKLHDDKSVVMIFPEGTRIDIGETGKYKIGGALLAQRAKVPVIPFAHNAGFYWRKRGLIKTPGKIKIVIGEAISTEGKSAAQIMRETEKWIRETQKRIEPS